MTLSSGVNGYPAGGALVTATYRTAFDSDNQPRPATPAVPSGTYVTYQSDVAAEYVTTPGRVWRWNDSPDNPPLAADVNPGVIIPQGAFQLDWQRVAAPPWDAIRALRGKVNQAEFLAHPAGCVLFLGAEASREFHFLPEGGFWRVAYRFQENTKELSDGSQVGWNYFYKETPVDGEHWVAIQDSSGNLPYAEGDFTELFEFG